MYPHDVFSITSVNQMSGALVAMSKNLIILFLLEELCRLILFVIKGALEYILSAHTLFMLSIEKLF